MAGRGHLFERVKDDVEHVRSVTWPEGGDDFRLDRTLTQLDELQGKLANHVYDERELEAVIDTLGVWPASIAWRLTIGTC
jgi:hypothetical protein